MRLPCPPALIVSPKPEQLQQYSTCYYKLLTAVISCTTDLRQKKAQYMLIAIV